MKAFTLIELLIVLSIILIICSLSIPTFFNYKQYALTHELEKLEAIFYYLQERAIATGQKHQLLFQVLTNSYSYVINQKNVMFPLATQLKFGFLKRAQGPPAQPVEPITQAITFKTDKNNIPIATFLPNGQMSSGTIYVIDREEHAMGALTCSVSQVSYIRRYLYTTQHSFVGWQLLA